MGVKKAVPEESQRRKIATQASLTPNTDEPKQRISKKQRAGLTLPVSRIYRQMKEGRIADRISDKSAITLASVIEYLTAEILEIAGEQCLAERKKNALKTTIKPRHILLGIRQDEEMSQFVGDIMIPHSGAVESIHPELQNKRKRNRKVNKMMEMEAEEAGEDSEEGSGTD